MRIHILSDVHLEFQKWRRVWSIPDADVHVLAGDIGVGLQGIAWALKTFTKPVIYVAGNHEFYGQRTMQDWWRKARAAVAGTHVSLLENDGVTMEAHGERVRFLGATLWTDYALFGADRREEMMAEAGRTMTDFSSIFLSRRGSLCGPDAPYESGSRHRAGDRLTPANALAMHQASKDYLERELLAAAGSTCERTVVVTHHAPSALCLIDGEANEKTDAAYASQLDHLVGQADLWIHGHIHDALDFTLPTGGRIAMNCRGYADSGKDAVTGFDPRRVIEV